MCNIQYFVFIIEIKRFFYHVETELLYYYTNFVLLQFKCRYPWRYRKIKSHSSPRRWWNVNGFHEAAGVLLNRCYVNNKSDCTSRQAVCARCGGFYGTANCTSWAVWRCGGLKNLPHSNNALVFRSGTRHWTNNFDCISDCINFYTNGDNAFSDNCTLFFMDLGTNWLFPYTALTDWFLWRGRSVFCTVRTGFFNQTDCVAYVKV